MIRRAEWRLPKDEPATVVGWIPRVLIERTSVVLLANLALAGIGWRAHEMPLFMLLALSLLVAGRVGTGRPHGDPSLLRCPFPKAAFPCGSSSATGT